MKTFFESSDFALLASPSDAEIVPLTVGEVEMFLTLDLTRQPGAEMPHFDERLAFARRLAWSCEGGAGVEMVDGPIFAQREFRIGLAAVKIGRWTDYNRDGVSRGWYAAILADGVTRRLEQGEEREEVAPCTGTATVTHAGHTFTATVCDERVTIAQDGVWAGEGRYTSHGIEDCPAVLGDDEEASEEIYRLLDAALAAKDEAITGRWVYVLAGSDSDYGVIRRVDGDRAEVGWSTEVVTWIDRSELVLCADRSEAEAAVDEAIRNA